MNENEINWEAPEFEYYPKGVVWFSITIFIAVLFLAIAIWQKNFLFGVFILLAEILILIWGNQKPRILNFKIDDDKIYAGEHNSYKIENIAAFAFTKSIMPGFWDLKIYFKNRFGQELKFIIPEEIYEYVRGFLIQKNILEMEYNESLIESLEKLAGF
jgi:hypothetical protein